MINIIAIVAINAIVMILMFRLYSNLMADFLMEQGEKDKELTRLIVLDELTSYIACPEKYARDLKEEMKD